MPSASIIIIGNEVLSGKFADQNGPYATTRLRELGCDLLRLAVIPDEVGVIAAEVRHCAALTDFVLTSGGVGPTHDDVTMRGIAQAFGVPLVRNPDLASIIQHRLGDATNGAALRMADVPDGSELWWDGELRFPLVVKSRVAIFPGVPEFFRLKFDAVARRFAGVPLTVRRLWTLSSEPEIADHLTEASVAWPLVAIGSYPRFELSPHKVLVTLESRHPDALMACEAFLRGTGHYEAPDA